jgi:leucyl-tRNA synthetase
MLPEVESYEPTEDGSSPLSRIDSFLNVTDSDGRLGRRETDTMGGFACSSWYFLRFCDPHNHEEPWNQERANYWMPVDCYVGGAEHAVMHLLYARFWTKVLFDLGLVNVNEPFQRLMNQGQVTAKTPYRAPREGERLDVGEDGILVSYEEAKAIPEDQLSWKWVRMSKSKGNVVTPDEMVAEYGADALRIYELFVAPFEAEVLWSSEGMQGAVRFLQRFYRLAHELKGHFDPNWQISILSVEPSPTVQEIRRHTHGLVLKATEDIERFAFNTYVSSCMVFLNGINDVLKTLQSPSDSERAALSEALEFATLVLAPAAPHLADEIWESVLGRDGFTYHADWPVGDERYLVQDTVNIAVQVNGKLRDEVTVSQSASKEEILAAAKSTPKIQGYLEGVTIRKEIYVPGKLVNLVVG